MPFGVAKAPDWLQYTMDTILGRVEGLPARAFFDDVQIPGTSWEKNWDDTIRTLEALADAGFMIYLAKCEFLRARISMLGVEVCGGKCRLGKKSLGRWAGMKPPRTLHDLQQILGRMLWASPFVPGFKRMVAPLEKLLGERGSAVWTTECTDAVNKIARAVFRRMELAIP